MKKIKIQNLLRFISVLVLIAGVCTGYDLADKMVLINQTIAYQFDFLLAICIWLGTTAFVLLFWALAKIIDLLEKESL